MKRIVLLLAIVALGLSATSFAAAGGPPPGKGKDKNKEPRKQPSAGSKTASDAATCRPQVSFILKGDFVSGGGDSFTMNVKSSNSHARQYAGKPLTLKVDGKTSFKRNGPATLADFKAGDRLNVQARACKAKKNAPQNPSANAQALLAKRVTGHPAKSSGSDDEEPETTTTTP